MEIAGAFYAADGDLRRRNLISRVEDTQVIDQLIEWLESNKQSISRDRRATCVLSNLHRMLPYLMTLP